MPFSNYYSKIRGGSIVTCSPIKVTALQAPQAEWKARLKLCYHPLEIPVVTLVPQEES